MTMDVPEPSFAVKCNRRSLADDVGDDAFHGSYERHLETAAPPGPYGDQRLGRSYSEMGQERNDCGEDDGAVTAEKEEGHDGYECSGGS